MAQINTNSCRWLFAEKWTPQEDGDWALLRPLKLLNKYERWRRVAKILKLSKTALLRLEWIIYNYEGHSVQETCRHFGIARKTFYKWFNRFDEDNIYSLYKLEDESKAPRTKRTRQITSIEEGRIVSLRRAHMRYGKMKLKKLYRDAYGEEISSWKIQVVIQSKKLYPNPSKTAKLSSKRKRAKEKKRKRIGELGLHKLPWYKKRAGLIICLDTIEIYWSGLKRYIFTAIDKYGKVAYARMYKTKSSLNGRDFLLRLHYLLDGRVPKVGHDNGSEFKKYFAIACEKMGIEQYHSRPRTPKDNPENERFNQTLETEFLKLGNFTPDVVEFNQRLTEWLIEYNFRRPHQSLNYQTPLEFSKVLPMYSSWTVY